MYTATLYSSLSGSLGMGKESIENGGEEHEKVEIGTGGKSMV